MTSPLLLPEKLKWVRYMSDIVITKWHDKLSILGFTDGTLEYLKVLDGNDRRGNVYSGRVENKANNIDALFVRFEAGQGKRGIGFLPIKTIPTECVLNRHVNNASEIKPGDILLVQIRTDEHKTKQARLSSKIKLHSSEYDGDLNKLINIAKTRTEHQLIINRGLTLSGEIDAAKHRLSKTSDTDDYKIVSDIKSICDELIENNIDCEYYDEEEQRISLAVHYSITSKTEDLLKKKVWLKSGGYIIVEQTETLNLIDVNSGKSQKKTDDFFLLLNKEAADECVRQIRLRNLSGMILIDFVSMKDKELQNELIKYIEEITSGDPDHLRFIDLTGLGIMEFTRDKKYKSLSETIDFKHL